MISGMNLRLLNLLLIFSFLTIDLFAQINGTWTKQSPIPTGSLLNDVVFINGSVGWAVGGGGTIIYTNDGGTSWTEQNSGIGNTLNGVSFVNDRNGWAVGLSSRVIRTVNGGIDWSLKNNGIAGALYGVSFVSSRIGWAVGQNANIYHTNNGGDTWNSQYSTNGEWLYGVSFVSSITGWAVGNNGTILHTTNGGTTWIPQTSSITNTLYEVTFIDDLNGWAVGTEGTILHTNNGGTNWHEQDSGISEVLWGISFVNSTTGWVTGANGVILHTNDGGSTWSSQSGATDNRLESVNFTNALNGWAVGINGTILHTSNGGASWGFQNKGTASTLNDVEFMNASTGWAVGAAGGTIVYTDDGGNTWNHQNSGTSSILRSVSFVNETIGWAVGHDGTIIHTSNGGNDWNSQNSDTGNWLYGVSFANSTTGWVVGASGILLHTTNGGNSWNPQNSETSDALFGVSFYDASTGWAVGANGTIIHTVNGGNTWIPQSYEGTGLLNSISFIDKLTGWAAGDNGVIIHTTDGGANWSTQNSQTGNRLVSVAFVDELTGWAAGQNGTIVHTTNGGISWSTQNSGTMLYLNGISFLNGSTGYAVGSTGTILKFEGPDLPSQVVLNEPANGSMNHALQPQLSWFAAANATTYDLQISGSSGFTSLDYTQSGLTSTSHTVTSDLVENNSNYWRVRGDNGGVKGPWSDFFSFTTQGTIVLSIPGPNEGWRMMGAPVPEATYGELLDGIWSQGFPGAAYVAGNSNVYWYSESDRNQIWKVPASAENIIGSSRSSGVSSSGRGFLVLVYEDDNFDGTSNGWPKKLSVTGSSPDSDLTLNLTNTTTPSDGYEGWHLLANPYPFTLDWQQVFNDSQTEHIQAVIEVWDANRDGGADYLVSGRGGDWDGLIAPFQGFWTRALNSDATVRFSPDHQAAGEADFRKQGEEFHITFSLEMEHFTTWTSLVFDDKKARSPDVYDAVRMNSLNPQYLKLFSENNDGTPLIVRNLPQTSNQTMELPLHVRSTQTGEATLTVSHLNLPDDVTIELVNRHSGRAVTVTENLNDTFTLSGAGARKVVDQESIPMGERPLVQKAGVQESHYLLRVYYSPPDQYGRDLPVSYSLAQNYPNPFNPTTIITYQLPEPGEVRLELFDLTGRRITTLVNQTVQAGNHQVRFDAGDLSSGVYIYRMTAGNHLLTRKLTLVK